MVSLLKLLNEWEIQLQVLFSFTLQVFLFFTGGLRQRTKNSVLRLFIWIAYLGADFVAVYALGLLSRLEDTATGKNTSKGTHQLAFFWTHFLLIHLGGQDTVTAFAIEDNSLWLRHLLNLIVQVNLALYAFWKSTSKHRTQLLLPSIFVFVTGIIKYGERTWALNLGNLKSLAGSHVPIYVRRLGGSIVRDSCLYADIVVMALYSMTSVRLVFGDVTFYHDTFDAMGRHHVRPELLMKFLEVELGLMYADIYTKAMVLRAKSGIILRSISQVSIAVAFVLFCVSNKQRYDPVDVAITYVLFVGGFSLEVCAMSMGMVSPWTCAWLKDQNWDALSRFILSKDLLFGWWRNRPLWSNSMGQYNLLNYLGQYDRQSSPWKRRLMTMIRKAVNIVGAGSAIKLWVSKLLDAKTVEVDEEIKACVIQNVLQFKSDRASMRQQWPNLGPFIQKLLLNHGVNFGRVIVLFHVYTEVQLSRYSPAGEEDEAAIESLMGVCRKLSHYMIYLLASLPETLPVKGFETMLRLLVARYTTADSLGTDNAAVLRQAMGQLEEWSMPEPQPSCTEATLVEMKEAWVQLLIYAADRCPPQVHAAQLARGGELLTLVWLLAAHYQLRDTGIFRIELTNVQPDQTLLYALHLQQDRGVN
ncbi:unnamed protein product [Urochloa decumbens]|uniref:DUF4220 domain-containing protein n=1 Tax=Urochloa decumbens TaxID=240449 RepID=A0ABC9DA23_9POAL